MIKYSVDIGEEIVLVKHFFNKNVVFLHKVFYTTSEL